MAQDIEERAPWRSALTPSRTTHTLLRGAGTKVRHYALSMPEACGLRRIASFGGAVGLGEIEERMKPLPHLSRQGLRAGRA
jgi:hypothetical protein